MPLATVTITDAEMKAINTTPKQLIAAPGAGKRIIIFGFAATSDTTTNGGVSVNANVRYAVVNQNVFGSFTVISSGANGPRETSQNPTPFNTLTNVLTNRAIEFVGSTNAGASYASSDGYHVAILYEEMQDPN